MTHGRWFGLYVALVAAFPLLVAAGTYFLYSGDGAIPIVIAMGSATGAWPFVVISAAVNIRNRDLHIEFLKAKLAMAESRMK